MEGRVIQDANKLLRLEVLVPDCSLIFTDMRAHRNISSITKKIDRGLEFFYTVDNNGLATYGALQLKADKEHPAGYCWSSRASRINALFNTKLLEIRLRDESGCLHSCAITLEKALKLLKGTKYYVKKVVEYEGDTVIEVHYVIFSADESENTRMQYFYGDTRSRKSEKLYYPDEFLSTEKGSDDVQFMEAFSE